MKRQTKIWVGPLIGVFLMLGFGPVAGAKTLVDPPPAQWGCELSEDKVLQGINGGLIGRGWVITDNDGAGHLVAQVIVRGKHTLVVTIDYTTTSFDINYKDSDRLKYSEKSDGTATIHKNANSWMNNIQMDIVSQLKFLCDMS